MKSLNVNLKNCYGIKKLTKTFEFSTKSNAILIYAPNGSMKTSFAKTLNDFSTNKDSRDEIFHDRETLRVFLCDGCEELKPDSVLVVGPVKKEFGDESRTSTLLVNNKLRDEYNHLTTTLQTLTNNFIKLLKKTSKTKKDIAVEISSTFTQNENRFHDALLRISKEVDEMQEAVFLNVPYDTVFNPNIIEFFNRELIQKALSNYIARFNNLIDNSQFFHRNQFTFFNAETIATNLKRNGFFEARHQIKLLGDIESKVIDSVKQLESVIIKEKDSILSDESLRSQFSLIEKELNKNATNRDFFSFIADNETIIPCLANIEEFKENVWKSYLYHHINEFKELLSEIESVKNRRRDIEAQARKEISEWHQIIETFNERFSVPFELRVRNLTDIQLGAENVPKLDFVFKESYTGQEEVQKSFDRNDLFEVLSTGEQRAFYILSVMFEINVRKKNNENCLLVMDDIADSFDYKNKYAIIEYISEISEWEKFRLIILTHNYDFFRIVKRSVVRNPNSCYLVEKRDEQILVKESEWKNNVFADDWKENFAKHRRKRIASIPFMRNLIEYIKDTNCEEYKTLTSLLHLKPDTYMICEERLFDIYEDIFGTKVNRVESSKELVIEIILKEANDCCNEAGDLVPLENKLVLAIAARIKAEAYMKKRINDDNWTESLKSMQTSKLLKKLRSTNPNDKGLTTLEKVNLMTSENIHLNAFMYEPIIDMSIDDLRRIFKSVQALEQDCFE